MVLDTPGGRFYAEWDVDAPVTREGQLIFFFQFLQAGDRWKEFLSMICVKMFARGLIVSQSPSIS